MATVVSLLEEEYQYNYYFMVSFASWLSATSDENKYIDNDLIGMMQQGYLYFKKSYFCFQFLDFFQTTKSKHVLISCRILIGLPMRKFRGITKC